MTTIKATCPTCGEVGLTPDEVELRVGRSERIDSYYAFTCPTCMDEVRKPADRRVVRLLVSGGVAVHDIEDRIRLGERATGPTLTRDDLLDFHLLLKGDDWFEQVRALAA